MMMLHQLTISTSTPTRLKPLIENAIQSELKTIAHGLRRTREQLAKFEAEWNLTTAEFERRFRARELPETLAYLDWWMEAEALHILEEQHQALSEARVD